MVAQEPMLATIIIYMSVVYGIMYLLVRTLQNTFCQADHSVPRISIRLCGESWLQQRSERSCLSRHLRGRSHLYSLVGGDYSIIKPTDNQLHAGHRA